MSDNSQDILFTVDGQTLVRTDTSEVVSNCKDFYICIFTIPEYWQEAVENEDTVITATFDNGRAVYSQILDDSYECIMPAEVLRLNDKGIVSVGLFISIDNVLITTTPCEIQVLKGSPSYGVLSTVTPTLFEQIFQKINDVVMSFVSDHIEYLRGPKGDKGDKGDSGEQGIQGIQGERGEQGLKGDKGDNGTNGKSAYQIAVDNGYSGTEQEWLASLKGAKGDKGEDGTSYDDTELREDIADIWKANVENNLIVEAYNFGGTWRNSQYWVDAQETFNGYTVKHRNAAWNALSKQVYVESGKIYTFSAWIKAADASDIRVYPKATGDTATIQILDSTQSTRRYLNVIPNNTWYKIMVTFCCTASGTLNPSVHNANSGDTYVSHYELVEGIPQGKVYHVAKDGSGDYTSFVDCINDACQYFGSTVYVADGTYDLLDELGTTYVESASNSNKGLVLKNQVHVICSSNTILSMKYTGSLSNVTEWLSAINTGTFGCILENAHIETDNVRYSIHDDLGDNIYPYRNKFINCTLKHTNGMYSNCIGGGLGKSADIEMRGCYLEGDINAYILAYYHGNNKSGETQAKGRIVVCDNYFANSGTFRMQNYGDSTLISTAYVSNNSFGADPEVISGSYAPNVNTRIIQWNNIIRTSHIYEEYLPTTANGTVKKYSAAIGATTATFNASAFMSKYNATSSDLNLDISAETTSGNVVAYNSVTINSSGVITITFDELTEAATFVCKASKIQ